MKTTNPDPSLELASRIYAFREDGESWTDAVDGFARSVLMRHPRTVHRWLAGESPIPKAVAAWIMDGTPGPGRGDAFAMLDAYENSIVPLDHMEGN